MLTGPQGVAGCLHDLARTENEHLRVVLQDSRTRPVRKLDAPHGSVKTSLIRTGRAFRLAVRANTVRIIVAHNRPSGESAPSPEDVAVTRVMVEAGRLLELEVLDHVMVSSGGFVSLMEKDLGFQGPGGARGLARILHSSAASHPSRSDPALVRRDGGGWALQLRGTSCRLEFRGVTGPQGASRGLPDHSLAE